MYSDQLAGCCTGTIIRMTSHFVDSITHHNRNAACKDEQEIRVSRSKGGRSHSGRTTAWSRRLTVWYQVPGTVPSNRYCTLVLCILAGWSSKIQSLRDWRISGTAGTIMHEQKEKHKNSATSDVAMYVNVRARSGAQTMCTFQFRHTPNRLSHACWTR